MKTKLFFRMTVIFLITMCISCSKEDVEDERINKVWGNIVALYVNYKYSNLIQQGDNFILTTRCKSGRKLIFHFPKQTGTYLVKDGKINLSCILKYSDYSCEGTDLNYDAIEGSITLLESNDYKIKGNFSFKIIVIHNEERNINGEFEIEY